MFLDKLKRLIFKNQQKETVKIEYSSPRNEYYGRVSEHYGTLQMLLLVLLTVVVLVSLVINSEWVSYENFYYFFSDFGDYITSADSDVENIIYNAGSFGAFGVFGEKLAVAGSTDISLYTASGRVVFSYDDPISRPILESTERYMLIYDSGASEYRIYNLFTEIHSEKLDYPVYGAAIADNGSYALITGDGKHISCVKIYNRRFDEQMSIGRSSYVTDVSMTPSGDRTALLSYSQSGGVFTTHLYLTRTSRSEPYADIEISGMFPVCCSFTENGSINVVCTDRILSYNARGKLVTEFMISDDALMTDVCANSHGLSILLSQNGKNRSVVFDTNGQKVYDAVLPENATDTELYGKYVYFLGDKNVLRLNLSNGRLESVQKKTNSEILAMLIKNENEVLLCMGSRVSYIKF